MKTIALPLLLLLSSVSYSQLFLPDLNVDPEPLGKIMSSFEPVLKKPVRAYTYVVGEDTILKRFFDRNGKEATHIDYYKNKPSRKSVYKYTNALNTEILSYVNGSLDATQNYTYDKNSNLTRWQRTRHEYDKQTQKAKSKAEAPWFFEYDAKNRLSKKYLLGLIKENEKASVSKYIYNSQGQPAEIIQEQWVTKFEYRDKLLLAKNKFYTNGPSPSIYSSSRYSYDAAGHVVKAVNGIDSTNYFYAGDTLKKMSSFNKDLSYQEITFFYAKNLLQRVEINATSASSQPAFHFSYEKLALSSWSNKQVNKLKMEFVYDERKTIKEIKYFIGDAYLYSKKFICSYY